MRRLGVGFSTEILRLLQHGYSETTISDNGPVIPNSTHRSRMVLKSDQPLRSGVESHLQGNPCHRLHDDTLGAAASFGLAFAHLHLAGRTAIATVAATAGRIALHLAVVATDLSDNIVESLVDVNARLGGRLDEAAAKRLCQCLAL